MIGGILSLSFAIGFGDEGGEGFDGVDLTSEESTMGHPAGE